MNIVILRPRHPVSSGKKATGPKDPSLLGVATRFSKARARSKLTHLHRRLKLVRFSAKKQGVLRRWLRLKQLKLRGRGSG
jgi:hypothetical protein